MTYNLLVQRLTECGSDSPAYEAAELITHFNGKSHDWCLMNREQRLPPEIERAAEKRLSGTPLQYITGRAYFYGDKYFVNQDVLIPQPDTEHIVHTALKHITPGSNILDLCTGSGCIIISIMKRVLASGTAVDISTPALQIAQRNAEIHKIGTRLSFLKADVLDSPLIPDLIAKADVITSNPPYINTDVIPTLSKEVQNEPRLALDGGTDGMKFYNRFITDYTKLMKPTAVMILEIGYDQSERFAALCKNANIYCDFIRDFGGNLRVAVISSSKITVSE